MIRRTHTRTAVLALAVLMLVPGCGKQKRKPSSEVNENSSLMSVHKPGSFERSVRIIK